jgi:C1A family cysteine protease
MKFTAALLGLASADAVENAYVNYMAEHGKSYATREEYEFRLAEFTRKVEFIKEHNGLGEGDHQVGLNHMADWTDMEYKKLLGYRAVNKTVEAEAVVGDIPASVDWRTQGAVTPVKNQGSCGSCWAFSTTGSMEGRYQIAGNTLTSFSEQQFVDCAGAEGNQGCNGGLMDNAFMYAEKTAVDTEAQYPYTGKDGTCHAATGVTTVASYTDVATNSPTALAAAVAEGPVSIAVDAAALGWQLYHGGILKRFCGTSLDHGVLLVGYGTEKGTDYWIVKNSWGAGWGEKGYLRILRDMTKTGPGVCGLQSQPSFPLF